MSADNSFLGNPYVGRYPFMSLFDSYMQPNPWQTTKPAQTPLEMAQARITELERMLKDTSKARDDHYNAGHKYVARISRLTKERNEARQELSKNKLSVLAEKELRIKAETELKTAKEQLKKAATQSTADGPAAAEILVFQLATGRITEYVRADLNDELQKKLGKAQKELTDTQAKLATAEARVETIRKEIEPTSMALLQAGERKFQVEVELADLKKTLKRTQTDLSLAQQERCYAQSDAAQADARLARIRSDYSLKRATWTVTQSCSSSRAN